jgi:flagellar protein FlaI
VIEEIQERRGWSRTELLQELRNRKRVLVYLQERDVTDYRQFTAIVKEYYADPQRILDRIDGVIDHEVTTGIE